MGRKLGRGSAPFWGRGAGSPSSTMWPGPRPTSVPSAILIHPAVWSQQTWTENWGCARFSGGGSWRTAATNTKSPEPTPTSIPCSILIHPAIWPQQTLAENWGLCPFEGGKAGSPSNTMWQGPMPTCTPSFILIHPTVWPQYTNVTDRQTGQTTDR